MKAIDNLVKGLDDVCERTKEGKWLKKKFQDFFYYPICPHCRRLDMAFDIVRMIWLIGMIIIGNQLIAMTEGEIESQCCQAYKQISNQFNSDVAFVESKDIKPQDYKKIIETNTPKVVINTPTTCPECKSTICPPQIICDTPEPCVCPEQVCPPRFTAEEEKWMLNYKPDQNSACYQSGGFDVKDDWLEYLDVPGRPKFKSRPSPKNDMSVYTGYKKETEATYCFKDLGNYFILNRTPDEYNRTRWGWNDDQCRNSALRVNHL